MSDKRLHVDNAKSHVVVISWDGHRYLYHDSNGWYVLCAQDAERHYLTVDGDGYFEGITVP